MTPEKPKRPPDPAGLKAFRDDANARERANIEAYDRAVLTLATASLGVSLTFIKDIVEPAVAIFLPILYASWAMLTLTVGITMASFLYGLHTIRASKDLAPSYYMQGNDNAESALRKWVARMSQLTYASAGLFLGGMASLALFVVLNIHHEANVMSNDHRGPGWVERGLPPGSFESFSTPQAETAEPATAPASQPASPQSETPAVTGGEAATEK